MWMSRDCGSEVRTPFPDRSVAILSFAMELRSSVEPLADTVSGVETFELLRLLESTDSPLLAALAACARHEQSASAFRDLRTQLADRTPPVTAVKKRKRMGGELTFASRRFCLDAEIGAIVEDSSTRRKGQARYKNPVAIAAQTRASRGERGSASTRTSSAVTLARKFSPLFRHTPIYTVGCQCTGEFSYYRKYS